jgi:hypothetical protein
VHEATAPVPDNEQVENVPVPVDAKVIDPVGVRAGAGEVSVTVTVQLVALFTTTVVGWHEMVVVVVRNVPVTLPLPVLDP